MMKHALKLLFALLFILNSNSFFAQQSAISETSQQVLQKKADKEAQKSTNEYRRKLQDDQSQLKKEQKKVEKHQRDLKNSQNDLDATNKKIDKLETANQKLGSKINSSSISPEDLQKQQIKLKEKDLEIQKLKLKKIEQQKKLDKVKSE
ncbi:MAG: hypothetical protein WAM46_03755 [Flavobacterium sp.]